MLIKVAWRNIWRNSLRSWVVISSIILGIWAGLFVNALMLGMNNQRTEELLNTSVSHIKIHSPEFIENRGVEDFIPEERSVVKELSHNEKIRSFSPRYITNAMVSVPSGAYGVEINAVDPAREEKVTIIHQKIIEGKFFKGVKRNPAVIGHALADKLGADIKSKIVLTFQSPDGSMSAGAFRVAGIFKSISSQFDESTLFVRQEDMYRILGSDTLYHEIAIMAKNEDEVSSLAQGLDKEFENLKARSWKELSPELGYTDELMVQMLYIIIGIIMLALAFGIVNTMLMAVLERKKELGMLMAVGMNRKRVFSMIILETVFLSLLGGPLGVALSYLTNRYFGERGIDLSAYSQGLQEFGVGTKIYTELQPDFYFNVALMVVCTAILAAIYPAYKALKLKPAEAVRGL